MEVLLIILLGFWVLGMLGRWSLRRWVARNLGAGGGEQAAARAQQRAQKARAAQQREAEQAKRREGEVSVKQPSAPEADKTVARDVGEYVEFEECE